MTFFKSKVADVAGVNAAVVAQFLWDNTCFDESDDNAIYENGRFWCRFSRIKMAANFSFLSEDQVDTAVWKLINAKIIKMGRHNESPFDKTCAYSFTEYGAFLMEGCDG